MFPFSFPYCSLLIADYVTTFVEYNEVLIYTKFSYHVSDLSYPARWYPPGTISNHSYTHCNLVVHPLHPPTMWAITTLWWSVLLPCTLFINNHITNHHCDISHLHRLWRHDICLFIYVACGSIHIVIVDKPSTIVWQDPWRVFNEDETWSHIVGDSSFWLLPSVILILLIICL